ncbi:hypothetical protein KS4_05340 [Poriferisphaera corsica]|uniref:Uncharacterized protein n=1 Tax=Poriferisphaera corsica TaxID=2528020 RepID=A0A517YQK3_9BACT|nr:hypothetical protein KS4_05340 [Poriferisphaera corsica]
MKGEKRRKCAYKYAIFDGKIYLKIELNGIVALIFVLILRGSG